MHEIKRDVLVVGNYCHDILVWPDRTVETLGGSSAYISAIFARLKLNFSVTAKVGEDFLYPSKVSRAPIVVKGYPTTHFVDDYTDGPRVAILRSTCEPIRAADLPNERALIGIACGVAMEILPETVKRLRELCDVVIADVQGLIRVRGEDGVVGHRPLNDTPFVDVLDCFDFLKADEEEAKFLDIPLVTSKCSLLITRSSQGCTILHQGKEKHLAAPKVTEVDATGAGDSFTAGFAFGLLRQLPAAAAAEFGNRFGAHAVTQVGVPRTLPFEPQL